MDSSYYPSLNGVQNVFYARYTQNGLGKYEPILQFSAFPSLTLYRYRLFSSLFFSLKGEIEKIFFCVSQHQGRKKYFNTSIQYNIWRYFFYFLSKQAGVEVGQNQASFVDMQCKESNLCRKRSSHKLAIQKVRIATRMDTINISTPQGVTYMVRLLGLYLLVRVRKKFPKVSLN